MNRFLAAAGLVAALSLGAASAMADTYSINRTPGAVGSVVGSITTDGTYGTLSNSNISDWDLVFTDAGGSFHLFGPLSGNNSAILISGSGLSATASELDFDFAPVVHAASDGRVLDQHEAGGGEIEIQFRRCRAEAGTRDQDCRVVA